MGLHTFLVLAISRRAILDQQVGSLTHCITVNQLQASHHLLQLTLFLDASHDLVDHGKHWSNLLSPLQGPQRSGYSDLKFHLKTTTERIRIGCWGIWTEEYNS